MYCRKCKEELKNDALYCENCGTPVSGNTEDAITPEAPNPDQYPMKWYKFLIYFSLFAGAVLNVISAFTVLTGLQYESAESSAALVYTVFPGLKAIDSMYGYALLALVVFMIFTRFALAKYKRFAPPCLYITYGAASVISLIYMVAVTGSTGVNVIDPSIFTSLISSVIMIVVNVIYFNKRKELFVY